MPFVLTVIIVMQVLHVNLSLQRYFSLSSMMCKFIDNIVIFILFHVKVPKGVYSLCKVLQKEVCHNFYALNTVVLASKNSDQAVLTFFEKLVSCCFRLS